MDINEDGKNLIDASAFVHPNVVMGSGNVIMEGVIIRDGVVIGNNNFFGAYCIIGDAPEKVGYFNKLFGVEIGNNNRFTKQVTIDSGTQRKTTIGNNNLLLKNSHVGHDALIYTGVILSCNSMVGGWCEVGVNCNIGLGAAIHQRVSVPGGIMLGMNSTITKKTELKEGMKYAGSPAKCIGENKR